MDWDKLRREDAESLGKALGAQLGIAGLDHPVRTQAMLTPEMERQAKAA